MEMYYLKNKLYVNVEENITLPLSLDNRKINKNHLDALIRHLGLESRREHLLFE